METDFKNRFNVIIDTNVIIASLLTSHEDSATAKVMEARRLLIILLKKI